MKKILSILLTVACILTLCGCDSQKTYTGKLEYQGKCIDYDFNVEVDTPILIREVEMVQYHKDDNGEVSLVLANYPIESFDNYINPEFNKEIESKLFYSELKINGVVLSEDMIKAIVYSDNVEKIKYTELDENICNKYGLILLDGSYVTASNDYNVGDIKVTYYYLNPNNIYNIQSSIIDSKLEPVDGYSISVE